MLTIIILIVCSFYITLALRKWSGNPLSLVRGLQTSCHGPQSTAASDVGKAQSDIEAALFNQGRYCHISAH